MTDYRNPLGITNDRLVADGLTQRRATVMAMALLAGAGRAAAVGYRKMAAQRTKRPSMGENGAAQASQGIKAARRHLTRAIRDAGVT